ncbi:MAG TPA: ferredoxin-type protein NapG [Bacteroidetes bacterium]|nr:quinol dehydrogenase periplasmic component [bacterium BMS3Bbin04]HDO66340.1 ferredoxin-type protein NapG [Bacteroidota bacterium]HEX05465.1 ferredoxin-type protein NapG [Bacteroidota bacterium]
MAKPGKSRREFILEIVRGAGATIVGGVIWGGILLDNAAGSLVLRPPGALESDSFLAHCLKCGLCVNACPYSTLRLADVGNGLANGTPHFEPRGIACEMCEDIPCTVACPSGALDLGLVSKLVDGHSRLDINSARMGIAKIDTDNCIAYWGLSCDVCYRVCPLMDVAIELEYVRNERTGVHAELRPVVNGDACTGCGKCEHACVTEEASIIVLPLEIAAGKVGSSYIKGWDVEDERRMKELDKPVTSSEAAEKTLDYLNTDDLFDE